MGETTINGLLWVIVAATLVPVIDYFIPRIKLPVVVLEILLGIAFGPHILGLVEHSEGLEVAKEFGVIFLFFLAGFEVDFEGIKGNPLRNAMWGWAGSIVIALAVAFGMQQLGLISAFHLVGIAIATTALGPLMPILQDSGQIRTRFGSNVLAIGAIGEFAPVLGVAFLFNESRAAFLTAMAIFVFMLVVLAILFLNRRLVSQGRSSHIRRIAIQTLDSSAQFGVRISILLLIALVYLAYRFDLDVLLGAFASGFIVGQLGDVASTKESRKVMEWMKTKFEAIGFGLFIPIFFVMTGVDFRLDTLFESTRAMVILPLAVIGSFLIRGVPVLLGYRRFERRMRWRLAFVSATQLPLVATLMERLIESGDVPADVGTAIVGAAVITVMVFPMVALRGLKHPDAAKTKEKVIEGLPEFTAAEAK